MPPLCLRKSSGKVVLERSEVGFGLLLWGLALPLGAPDKPISFLTLSGTTFFTLGLGDVTPISGGGRVLVVSEVPLGFIFLALVISYVPHPLPGLLAA